MVVGEITVTQSTFTGCRQYLILPVGDLQKTLSVIATKNTHLKELVKTSLLYYKYFNIQCNDNITKTDLIICEANVNFFTQKHYNHLKITMFISAINILDSLI
jgi:hypothetical protein